MYTRIFIFFGCIVAVFAVLSISTHIRTAQVYSDTENVPVATTTGAALSVTVIDPHASTTLSTSLDTHMESQNPIATITTNKGVFKIELFEDTMPITAGNFRKLAESGYFTGIKFHRVVDGFMIQSGDPLTKDDEKQAYWGTGGPGYTIEDEHVAGELLTNTRGTIAMANSGPQSGGSQFFINLGDNSFLDFDKPPVQSKHPVFGRVIDGMDVVDVIASVEVTMQRSGEPSLPVEPIIIESVVVAAQ